MSDPDEPETWLATAVQTGAAGLYGDFFLGKLSRFGNDVVSALAGPLPGEPGSTAQLVPPTHNGMSAITSETLDQALNTAMSGTPNINLWFTRAALDYLILHRLNDWLSPGYVRRMRRRLEQHYEHTPIDM